MKSPISKTARLLALLAAVSIMTLPLYVHAVDREYLGAPATEVNKGRTEPA